MIATQENPTYRDKQNNIIFYRPEDIIIDSIPPPSNRLTCQLRKFQQDKVNEIFHLLHGPSQLPCVICEAPTGSGKTYIAGGYLDAVISSNWLERKTVSPWPMLYVTKATVVEQTERVLRNDFGLGPHQVMVTNYDKLRSSFGEIFLKEETVIEQGEEHIQFKWHNNIQPAIVVWDEAHNLKNKDSLQSKVQQAFNEAHNPLGPIKQIFLTATPFTCVVEARYLVVACRMEVDLV